MTPGPVARANIALTGFMAAGKTVTGRSLARSLDWAFVDLDAVIEESEGSPVREIFARRGEGWFREREKAALGRLLDGSEQVIALGGGAVVDPDSRSRLKERSLLVWLRVAPATVLRRTRGDEDRPLLRGRGAPADAEAAKLKRIEELSAQREGIYAEAHITVDTDDLTVEQVVQRIRQRLCRP